MLSPMHHTKTSNKIVLVNQSGVGNFLGLSSVKASIVCYIERLCGKQVFDGIHLFTHECVSINNCKWTWHSLTEQSIMDTKLTSNQ